MYTAVDTIVKYLNNNEACRHMHATGMGCGGKGKAYIINTMIIMVKSSKSCNGTVQVAALSGSAAFYIKGSPPFINC